MTRVRSTDRWFLKLLLLAFIAAACEATAQDAQCVRERAAMVEAIRAYVRSDVGLLGPQGISESVLEAVRQTERHRFIPGRSCSAAYMDGPVPIGQGQTISQPFIVALMTHLASVKSDQTVLEVGTGSGYQAAILARLVRKAFVRPGNTRSLIASLSFQKARTNGRFKKQPRQSQPQWQCGPNSDLRR